MPPTRHMSGRSRCPGLTRSRAAPRLISPSRSPYRATRRPAPQGRQSSGSGLAQSRARLPTSASASTRTTPRRRSPMRSGSAPSASRMSSAITTRAAAMAARRWPAPSRSRGRSARPPGSKPSSPASMASRRRSLRSARPSLRSARRSRLCLSRRPRISSARFLAVHGRPVRRPSRSIARRGARFPALRLGAECSATSPSSTANARRSPSSIS